MIGSTITPRVPIEPGTAATSEWVLTIAIDAAGRLDARGVPLVQQRAIQVFVDGVLADRDDLARTAGLPASSPDGELILAAYERRGELLFPTLRGWFMIAIVDRARNIATILRDPTGSHPVFYAKQGSSTLFASSTLELVQQPGVSRALNRPALADQLCKRWPRGGETFFEAVHRVPSRSCAIVTPERVIVRRYWLPEDVTGWLTPAEVLLFDERLDRAVRRCSEGGRLGIFLSGGFDSVSVAAVAADLGGPQPLALSIAFPDPTCDERAVQASVARTLGLSIEMVDFDDAVGPRGLLAEGLDLNRGLGAPLFNTWAPAYFELARRGRLKGVDTVLTGEGGDELLGVSPYLVADLIRRGDFAGVARFARTWRRSFDTPLPIIVGKTIWNFGLRPLAGSLLGRIAPAAWDRSRARRQTKTDPDWVAPDPDLRREQRRRAGYVVPSANPNGGFYARDLRDFLDDPLTSWHSEEQYQFGRLQGIRYRHPYWDADLLLHLYRTPPECLTKGDRAKSLLRDAMARRFPGLGFETQRKVSALNFFHDTLASQAPRLAAPFADFRALAGLGVVDPTRARAFVATALRHSPRSRGWAWNLINTEAWVRTQV